GASSHPTADEALRRYEETAGIVAKDLSFVLDRLARVSSDARSALHGRIDLAHVGVAGHSLGGAAVLQIGRDDRRVSAVFDIDGSPVWNESRGELAKPLLILSAASTNVGYGSVLRGAKPALHLRVAGTVHTF